METPRSLIIDFNSEEPKKYCIVKYKDESFFASIKSYNDQLVLTECEGKPKYEGACSAAFSFFENIEPNNPIEIIKKRCQEFKLISEQLESSNKILKNMYDELIKKIINQSYKDGQKSVDCDY